MTFRDNNNGGKSYVSTKFPEGPECKGSITIQNVPSDVKSITYLLSAYNDNYGSPKLSGDRISFKNVPVFK